MKKILTGTGVILAGLAVALVAMAATGDAVYIGLRTSPQALTGEQKALIGTAVSHAFNVSAAAVDTEHCWQTWLCDAADLVTLTDEEYLDLDLAGELADPTQATATRRQKAITLAAQEITEHEAVTQAVWGLPMDEISEFWIWRDPVGSGNVLGQHKPILTATPAEWRALRQGVNGLQLQLIGKVAE